MIITKEKLKKIEDKLLKDIGLLEIKGLDKSKLPKDLKDGIIFLTKQTHNNLTIYPNGNIQCDTRCRRSFGDIFLIIKSYYPEISFRTVRDILIAAVNDKYIAITYCPNINKRVIVNPVTGLEKWTQDQLIFDPNIKDEHGLTLYDTYETS